MIVTFRPDLPIENYLDVLHAPAPGDPLLLAGREAIHLPLGRDGITWALRAMRIGAGDEVAVPALTSDTVAEAILATGATPVTFGCLPDLNPSPEHCAAALSLKTRAVIVPHLYGMRTDLSAFVDIARERHLLFIEDCAHYVSELPGPNGEGITGDCSIYSFHSGKPLSLDWGGAMTLSPEFLSSAGRPEFSPMDERHDRLLFAGSLAQRLIEDPSHLKHKHVSSTYALTRFGMLETQGVKQPPAGDAESLAYETESAVEQFLSAAAQRPSVEELRELCLSLVGEPHTNPASKLAPSYKRILKMMVPRRLQSLVTGVGASALVDELRNNRLMPGGLAERLLRQQYDHFLQGKGSASRARIAAVYVDGLDPDKFWFPASANVAAHWLVFPVVMKNPRIHDRLEYESADKLQIDIAPWMWPLAIQDVPYLRRKVKAGAGSREVSRAVAGLFNLPVHSQMDTQQAEKIVTFLNTAV